LTPTFKQIARKGFRTPPTGHAVFRCFCAIRDIRAILSSIILSHQCCEVDFIISHSRLVNPGSQTQIAPRIK